MTQRELRESALAFVCHELPYEFEDCITRLLDRFPEHLQKVGPLSDIETEDLVYSDHYCKHIKDYLTDFITGKIFVKAKEIPTTAVAVEY